jgi:hypothetical protein
VREDALEAEWIEVATAADETSYRPGDALAGSVTWRLAAAPESVELRLFWYTVGKGTQDVGVVETQALAAPGTEDSRSFVFRLPDGPYSFSGRLISLIWAVEAVVRPGPRAGRREIVLSPTGEEIVLEPVLGVAAS